MPQGLALAQSICLRFALNAGLGNQSTHDQLVNFIDFEKVPASDCTHGFAW